MKVKVLVDNEDKNMEFKVRRMTYIDVVLNYPSGTGLKNYKYNEVELISESKIDEFLINNMEFLKIKLNRGISVFFYEALKDALEDEINEELNSFVLFRDKYNVNKKGMWNKELICMINEKKAVKVIASGKNFKRDGYSISVDEILKDDFLEAANEEIHKIQEEIKRKEMILSLYENAIKTLKTSAVEQYN